MYSKIKFTEYKDNLILKVMELIYIILIILLCFYLLISLMLFFKKICSNDIDNICMSFIDSLLWPGDIINNFYCIKSKPKNEEINTPLNEL